MITETQIGALNSTLQNYPEVQFAYLFGSQATGNVTPMSDKELSWIESYTEAVEKFL